MRIYVATAGGEPHNQVQRDVFAALADEDDVGEHGLEDDPARADVLFFVDLHQHPGDPLLSQLRRHDLVRRWPRRVRVYDERDQPFFTFPGIYVAGTPRAARRLPIVGGPYPALPNAPDASLREPSLLFSFQGSRTHRVRSAILELTHPRAVIEDTSGIRFFAWDGSVDPQRETAEASYARVVRDSKFVLCPRGHSPTSFRLYETLAAGRVPVVISDDWLPPPRIAWDRCVVRVRERDVRRIVPILESIEETWPAMARAGAEVVGEHFGRSRLWHHYACSLADLGAAPRQRVAPWWAQGPVVRVQARRARDVARRLRVHARSPS